MHHNDLLVHGAQIDLNPGYADCDICILTVTV